MDLATSSLVSPAPTKSFTPTRTQRRRTWQSRYARLLVASDALVVAAAVFGTQALWLGPDHAGVSAVPIDYTTVSLLLCVAWLIALTLWGTRLPRVVGHGVAEHRLVIAASFQLFGLIAMGAYLTGVDLSRGYFLLSLPVGTLTLLASRSAARAWLVARRRRGGAVRAGRPRRERRGERPGGGRDRPSARRRPHDRGRAHRRGCRRELVDGRPRAAPGAPTRRAGRRQRARHRRRTHRRPRHPADRLGPRARAAAPDRRREPDGRRRATDPHAPGRGSPPRPRRDAAILHPTAGPETRVRSRRLPAAARSPQSAAARPGRPRAAVGPRPDPVPAGTRRSGRRPIRDDQVPLHGRRRRRPPVGTPDEPGTRRRPPVQDRRRPAYHADRPHPAEVLARRDPAAVQRAGRADEPRRAASAARCGGGVLRRRRPASLDRPPRNERSLAGERTIGAVLGGCHPPRPLLRRELVADRRPRHPVPHREGRLRPRRHRALPARGGRRFLPWNRRPSRVPWRRLTPVVDAAASARPPRPRRAERRRPRLHQWNHPTPPQSSAARTASAGR